LFSDSSKSKCRSPGSSPFSPSLALWPPFLRPLLPRPRPPLRPRRLPPRPAPQAPLSTTLLSPATLSPSSPRSSALVSATSLTPAASQTPTSSPSARFLRSPPSYATPTTPLACPRAVTPSASKVVPPPTRLLLVTLFSSSVRDSALMSMLFSLPTKVSILSCSRLAMLSRSPSAKRSPTV
ncbi:hypothetical protein CI238_03977, partial [Colletotrichum incanum]